jgi:protein TonB
MPSSGVYNSRVASAALAVKEGIAPVRDRLVTMWFLAALLHAMVILGITFGSESGGGSAPGLKVLLVSTEMPEAERNDDAAYLAQRTQLGSGTDAAGSAARSQARMGSPDQPAPEQRHARDERVLTAHVQSSTIRYIGTIDTARERPPPTPAALVDAREPQAVAGEDLEPSELAGPARDELWVTPDTRESSLAPYLDAWRRKVERLGTLNYPAAARQAAGTTSPVLEVAIAADGTLASADIQRTSGSPELDAAAISILRLASPFEPFPRELAANYRVLRFAYAWEFAGNGASPGTVTAPADSR